MFALAHRHQMAACHARAYESHARLADAELALAEMRAVVGRTHVEVPAADPAGRFQALSRVGHVVVTTGDGPAPAGTVCTVSATPTFAFEGYNCRLEVNCAGQIVYGGADRGYMRCGYRDGLPSFGADRAVTHHDGDPRLDLDLESNRVVVSDGPTPRYSIAIALDRF
jgi:hypothetical protein